jgi:hypothetical protein
MEEWEEFVVMSLREGLPRLLLRPCGTEEYRRVAPAE